MKRGRGVTKAEKDRSYRSTRKMYDVFVDENGGLR